MKFPSIKFWCVVMGVFVVELVLTCAILGWGIGACLRANNDGDALTDLHGLYDTAWGDEDNNSDVRIDIVDPEEIDIMMYLP